MTDYKLANRILLHCILLSFFILPLKAFPIPSDSTAMWPPPAVTPAPICLTQVTVSGATTNAQQGSNEPAVDFPALASTKAGGILCPGKYTATVYCSAAVQSADACSCYGVLVGCPWSITFFAGNQILATPIPGPSGHGGSCIPPLAQANLCQNIGNIGIYFNTITLDTNVLDQNRPVYFLGYVKCGGFNVCTVSVTKQLQAY